jgi:hypothetical protein
MDAYLSNLGAIRREDQSMRNKLGIGPLESAASCVGIEQSTGSEKSNHYLAYFEKVGEATQYAEGKRPNFIESSAAFLM